MNSPYVADRTNQHSYGVFLPKKPFVPNGARGDSRSPLSQPGSALGMNAAKQSQGPLHSGFVARPAVPPVRIVPGEALNSTKTTQPIRSIPHNSSINTHPGGQRGAAGAPAAATSPYFPAGDADGELKVSKLVKPVTGSAEAPPPPTGPAHTSLHHSMKPAAPASTADSVSSAAAPKPPSKFVWTIKQATVWRQEWHDVRVEYSQDLGQELLVQCRNLSGSSMTLASKNIKKVTLTRESLSFECRSSCGSGTCELHFRSDSTCTKPGLLASQLASVLSYWVRKHGFAALLSIDVKDGVFGADAGVKALRALSTEMRPKALQAQEEDEDSEEDDQVEEMPEAGSSSSRKAPGARSPVEAYPVQGAGTVSPAQLAAQLSSGAGRLQSVKNLYARGRGSKGKGVQMTNMFKQGDVQDIVDRPAGRPSVVTTSNSNEARARVMAGDEWEDSRPGPPPPSSAAAGRSGNRSQTQSSKAGSVQPQQPNVADSFARRGAARAPTASEAGSSTKAGGCMDLTGEKASTGAGPSSAVSSAAQRRKMEAMLGEQLFRYPTTAEDAAFDKQRKQEEEKARAKLAAEGKSGADDEDEVVFVDPATAAAEAEKHEKALAAQLAAEAEAAKQQYIAKFKSEGKDADAAASAAQAEADRKRRSLQRSAITITAADIGRTNDGVYYSDALIDMWNQVMYRHMLGPSTRAQVHFHSSFLFKTLYLRRKNYHKHTAEYVRALKLADRQYMEKYSLTDKERADFIAYKLVANRTKHVDIFAKKLVLMDVCMGDHWSLVALCNLDKVGQWLRAVDTALRTKTKMPTWQEEQARQQAQGGAVEEEDEDDNDSLSDLSETESEGSSSPSSVAARARDQDADGDNSSTDEDTQDAVGTINVYTSAGNHDLGAAQILSSRLGDRDVDGMEVDGEGSRKACGDDGVAHGSHGSQAQQSGQQQDSQDDISLGAQTEAEDAAPPAKGGKRQRTSAGHEAPGSDESADTVPLAKAPESTDDMEVEEDDEIEPLAPVQSSVAASAARSAAKAAASSKGQASARNDSAPDVEETGGKRKRQKKHEPEPSEKASGAGKPAGKGSTAAARSSVKMGVMASEEGDDTEDVVPVDRNDSLYNRLSSVRVMGHGHGRFDDYREVEALHVSANYHTWLDELAPAIAQGEEEEVPAVIILDSLDMHSITESYELACLHVLHEWIDRQNGGQPLGGVWRTVTHRDLMVRGIMRLLLPEKPRQSNGYDCGVFVLKYAEVLCQRLMSGLRLTKMDADRVHEQGGKEPLREVVLEAYKRVEERDSAFRQKGIHVPTLEQPLPPSNPSTSASATSSTGAPPVGLLAAVRGGAKARPVPKGRQAVHPSLIEKLRESFETGRVISDYRVMMRLVLWWLEYDAKFLHQLSQERTEDPNPVYISGPCTPWHDDSLIEKARRLLHQMPPKPIFRGNFLLPDLAPVHGWQGPNTRIKERLALVSAKSSAESSSAGAGSGSSKGQGAGRKAAVGQARPAGEALCDEITVVDDTGKKGGPTASHTTAAGRSHDDVHEVQPPVPDRRKGTPAPSPAGGKGKKGKQAASAPAPATDIRTPTSYGAMDKFVQKGVQEDDSASSGDGAAVVIPDDSQSSSVRDRIMGAVDTFVGVVDAVVGVVTSTVTSALASGSAAMMGSHRVTQASSDDAAWAAVQSDQPSGIHEATQAGPGPGDAHDRAPGNMDWAASYKGGSAGLVERGAHAVPERQAEGEAAEGRKRGRDSAGSATVSKAHRSGLPTVHQALVPYPRDGQDEDIEEEEDEIKSDSFGTAGSRSDSLALPTSDGPSQQAGHASSHSTESASSRVAQRGAGAGHQPGRARHAGPSDAAAEDSEEIRTSSDEDGAAGSQWLQRTGGNPGGSKGGAPDSHPVNMARNEL